MHAQILTIDLGNSRAKLALFAPRTKLDRPEDFLSESRFDSNAGLVPAIEQFLASRPEIVEAVLSSVAAPSLEDAVAGVLERRFTTPVFHRNPPVAMGIHYEPKSSLGRDRLYAARGALAVVAGPALVVDAGTALTVDLVSGGASTEFHEKGIFRGGAIAPGPRLLADALHQHTARLPRIEPRPGAEHGQRKYRGSDPTICRFHNASLQLLLKIPTPVPSVSHRLDRMGTARTRKRSHAVIAASLVPSASAKASAGEVWFHCYSRSARDLKIFDRRACSDAFWKGPRSGDAKQRPSSRGCRGTRDGYSRGRSRRDRNAKAHSRIC